MNKDDLINKAVEAKDLSYSPYSNFRVGAAVLTKNGKIFQGANIENSSYGLTICAERNAVFASLLSKESEITGVAVCTDLDEFCPPCGSCRQVLSEFCDPDTEVIMVNNKGEYKSMSLSQLLPLSFNKNYLDK